MITVNRGNFRRWMVGILAGSAMLAAAAPVYADTTSQNAGRNHRGNGIEKLVEDGTIDQSTYEAIEAYMESNGPERTGKGADRESGFFSDAVNDGIITQETADKLEEYMKTRTEERRSEDGSHGGERGADMWNAMLTAGVITQAEYDSIQAAMPQKPAEASVQ